MSKWIQGETKPYMTGFPGVDEIATGGVQWHEYQRDGSGWVRRTVCSNAGFVDTSSPEWVDEDRVPADVRQ